MAKSFNNVLDEYKAFRASNPDSDIDVTSFAKQMDEVEGTPSRTSAYSDGFVKRLDAGIDRAFEATHLPDLTGGAVGALGTGFDKLVGTNIAPVVEQVGRDVPRMIVEGALTIPEVASGVGAPAAAATWANRIRKIAGYGSAATHGWAQTDSPVGGAIAAGTMGLGNKLLLPAERGGLDVGGRAASAVKDYMARGVADIVPEEGANLLAARPAIAGLSTAESVLPIAARTGADLATMTGLNEASRQASLSVGPNAVELTDPQRNPLTAENIAGNVAGALPFVPQAVLAFHERPRLVEKGMTQMDQWLKKRQEAEITQLGFDHEGPISPTAYYDAFGKTEGSPAFRGQDLVPLEEYWTPENFKDVNGKPLLSSIGQPGEKFSPEQVGVMQTSLRAQLDAAAQQESEGQTELASKTRESIHSLIGMLSETNVPPEVIAEGAKQVGEVSRSMPPETPQGFAKFVQDVNGFIDQLNEGRVNAENVLNTELPVAPEKITNERELTAWQLAKKAKQEQVEKLTGLEKSKGESWHPSAASKEVVERLQSKGLVEKVTPEWLSKEFNATFNESGDAQFAYHVVVQKVANRLLDNLPAALRAEAENPGHVQTEYSDRKPGGGIPAGVKQINEQEHKFYDALSRLPEEIKDDAIARTVEVSKKPEVYYKGRMMNQLSSWRQAVVLATKSYDPASQTILQNTKGKLKRVSVKTLVLRDEHGEYVYKPITSPVKIGEGGKGSVKVEGQTLPEGNIESLPSKNQNDPYEVLDEDVFKQTLAEEGIGGSLQTKDEAGLGEGKGSSVVDVPIEQTATEKSAVADLQKKSQSALANLDKLTDEQLYNVVRPAFQSRDVRTGNPITDRFEAWRKPLVRAAVKAQFENYQTSQAVGPAGKAFLAAIEKAGRKLPAFAEKKQLDLVLQDFFKATSKLEGGKEGVRADLARVGLIVDRLADPKIFDTVSRAKVGEESQRHGDLVTFAAPVRLKRWLSSENKGSYTPDIGGAIPTKNVIPLLQKLGIGKDELALYKSLGLDYFLSRQRVKVEELSKWMDEHVPKVEVKKLLPTGETPENVRRGAEIQHQFETAGYTIERDMGGDVSVTKNGEFVDTEEIPKKLIPLVEEYIALIGDEGGNDAATGKYGVDPKELKNMPGAVDILVRVPSNKPTSHWTPKILTEAEAKNIDKTSDELYRGPHFGGSDVNVLASVRGYVETLPSGDKVFHVFEVQSDWGQKRSKGNNIKVERLENGKYGFDRPAQMKEYDSKQDAQVALDKQLNKYSPYHPLLAVYEQLALKAAIDHARKEGINRIALSDADTVLWTEGHYESTNIPKQKGGMEAAYNQRMPQVMEKLGATKLGDVDFGQNVKAPTGHNIKARLYDISSAPDEFSAFGYSRPKVGEEGSVTGSEISHPGNFVDEAAKAVRQRISDVLGKAGYAGTYRDLMTEVGVALLKQGEGLPLSFNELTGSGQGRASATTKDGGSASLGLNLSLKVAKGDERRMMNNLLDTIAHEMSHVDDFVRTGMIGKPDAFSQERLRHLNNLNSLAEVLGPEERQLMIQTLRDALVPKDYQPNTKEQSGRVYGSDSPEEFTAEITSMVSRSLLQGKKGLVKTAMEVLDYSPTEVREFARGTYRTIADVLDGLKGAVDDKVLSEALHATINAAREGSTLRDADKALAQARAFTSSMSNGAADAPPKSAEAMWFRAAEDVRENFRPEDAPDVAGMANAAEAVKMAGDHLTKTKGYDDKMKPGVWATWFYPFAQLMHSMERSGVPLARPVMNLSQDLQGTVSRLRSEILSPFVKHDKSGAINYDNDNTLIRKVSKDPNGNWRKGVNLVSRWQQENGTKSMFMVDEKGNVVPTKEGQAKWDSMRAAYSVEDQQVIASSSVALDQTSQNAARLLVGSINEANVNRTATLLMLMNPKMTYEQAFQVAGVTVTSYLNKDVSSLSRTAPPDQLARIEALLGGKDGLISHYLQVQDKLESRPGFRTETLPGDWIVRFRTPGPDGQVKFLSASSDAKAKHLAARLRTEGNVIEGEIVRKQDLKDYTDFDDPDTILRKFAEVEERAWNGLAAKMEQQYGSEFADSLRNAYVPGAAGLKEIGLQGMNKFLTERRSMVDRERYDYIDGTMNWAGRLAASMAYKSTNGTKGLIMADPRAKMFPSFQKLVDTHFDNLMTPTSELTKELKSVAGAYFLGGNLASSIVNASQSVTTLVPQMIAFNKSGGPVKAWGQLMKAVGNATWVTTGKDWERVARVAEGKDPSTWTKEESLAANYKRHIASGGIQQTVSQDLFNSRDQNMLMTAKFGHGDYGPTTKSEMARNGLYTANQALMWLYSHTETFNNKISFMAGIAQGYENGLRGDALYDHAKLLKVLTTYSGGKANVPGWVPRVSTPYTRSAVGVVNTLQQYGYGVVASYAQLAKDSLGKTPGLSALERRQSQKAFGTMLVTQVALGGALGLPFAAASLTILEKVFGIQANAAVRQGLASLGSDEDQGAVIAETSLNGLGNQMLGLDVSSRLGTSSILGTSAYRGFAVQDMLGPVGSIVGNMVESLNLFGQGEPVKAASMLVPSAFRTIVQQSDTKAKYGDSGIRDAGGNLIYTPTPSQAAAYMVGFRPRESSQKIQAQHLSTVANQQATRQRSREVDRAAESLLAGDPTSARNMAQGAKAADFTVNPRDIYNSIINRAVDSSTEKDLLASGPSYNEGDRQAIAGTFGEGVVTRQSELDRTQLRAQLAARVGAPELMPGGDDYKKAAIVDSLTKQKTKAHPNGMPRSQALRLVEFLKL